MPTDLHRPAPAPAVLHDRAAAEAYVAFVCFKHGPPRRIGVELEWIIRHADDPCRHLDADHLADALGPYAPDSLNPDSPHHRLPAGSTLTVEPGGQVEISTPPHDGLQELLATASSDAATVAELLEYAGLRVVHAGADPYRKPRRLLRSPRYVALEAHLDRGGPSGRTMMASTAAVQVNVDAGEDLSRWRALHLLGPVLLATFANSPVLGGVRTGWASSRMAAWFGIAPPVWDRGDDAAQAYARRVLDSHLVCVRRNGDDWRSPPGVTFADWIAGKPGAPPAPPTEADLDYHLSTLFPPVRPRGHFEVRYLDAQPDGRWAVPVAVLHALMDGAHTTASAVALARPTAHRWYDAARYGLADRALADVARSVLALASRRLHETAAPDWLCEQVAEHERAEGLRW